MRYKLHPVAKKAPQSPVALFFALYMCGEKPPCPEYTRLCSAVPRCVRLYMQRFMPHFMPRYTPRHCGARFSLKASAASPKSSVISASTCTWFSRSKAEAKLGASRLLHITRLVCSVL